MFMLILEPVGLGDKKIFKRKNFQKIFTPLNSAPLINYLLKLALVNYLQPLFHAHYLLRIFLRPKAVDLLNLQQSLPRTYRGHTVEGLAVAGLRPSAADKILRR